MMEFSVKRPANPVPTELTLVSSAWGGVAVVSAEREAPPPLQ